MGGGGDLSYLSFFHNESHERNLDVTFDNSFDIGISFKDPELLYLMLFEMNQ